MDTAVHMLDNVIDMNRYPIPEIEAMTRRTRRIGLGVMGTADLLMIMGVPYDSEEALGLAGSVLGYIHDQTHRASRKLAEARGDLPGMGKQHIQRRGRERAERDAQLGAPPPSRPRAPSASSPE